MTSFANVEGVSSMQLEKYSVEQKNPQTQQKIKGGFMKEKKKKTFWEIKNMKTSSVVVGADRFDLKILCEYC
jgi:hypothetical protein